MFVLSTSVEAIDSIIEDLAELEAAGGSEVEDVVGWLQGGAARLYLCGDGWVVAYITHDNYFYIHSAKGCDSLKRLEDIGS